MNRRESFKTLFIGTIAGSTLATGAVSCQEDAMEEVIEKAPVLYGRTPAEMERDAKLFAEVYLNAHELATIAILCDIILPATPSAGSATDAGVPEFIEFIVKDLPRHQLPLRGGLMWIDGEAMKRFGKAFKDCENTEQIAIIDDIAYPDPDEEKPEFSHGIKFFDLMRNLTLTGYYTTKMGIDDLGYVGNRATIWDGVPADVLKDHEVDYDPEWLAKCVDQSKRDVMAEWDAEGNLLT